MKITEVKAIQDLSYCLWDGGCYFFCLCAIAEKITGKEIDVLKTAWKYIQEKKIDYDVKRPRAYNNCMYIYEADTILSELIGEKYRIKKVEKLPQGYTGYYIERWKKNNMTHFVLPDYDTMTYSSVRAEGKISAYYLVEKVSS